MSLGQAPKGQDPRLACAASGLKNSRVLYSEPMSEHTSFKIGGPCDLLIMPGSAEDAVQAWVSCRESALPCHVIGNGTNLLVRDGGIRGCLIKMAPGSNGLTRNGDTTLQVRAGTLLPRLVQAALHENLSGLEWAIGIPGSVGGAVTMNAGAYGGDFGSLVTRVQVATVDGGVQWMDSNEVGFGYRHSLFTERDDLMILTVDLRLSPGDRNIIYDVMLKRAREREEKQPLDMPSAGSAFRRPPGHYVGAMIDSLGLKGAQVGGAQVSTKHAGFIVNTGNATARDVEGLISLIQAKVKEGFGVDLQPEIVIVGEDSPPQQS
ncbi:MAG: UDP-N-acetylmuramate dehydrogenase [Bacillota bacterium]